MYRAMDTTTAIKFTLLLIPILFASVCATTPKILDSGDGKNITTAKPVKKLTMKSVAGTYEDELLIFGQFDNGGLEQLASEDAGPPFARHGKATGQSLIIKWIFLENGLFYGEWNNSRVATGKWKLVDEKIHAEVQTPGPSVKLLYVYIINEDGSITCSEMTMDGKRTIIPKDMYKQITYKRIK